MTRHHARSESEYSEPRQWRGLLERLLCDTSLLPLCWSLRRDSIERAIERDEADLAAIMHLLEVLGEDPQTARDQTRIEREGVERSRLIVSFLDEVARLPTGAVLSTLFAQRCTLLWLSLEARFIPDEQGWLASLRDHLIKAANVREIDLRGLDL
ncbi:MAG: hypothetical protein GY722_29460 [bacterium]|nr:hypothetical protein [bacterium]